MNLYAEGLKAKLEQAQFSLRMLRWLDGQEDYARTRNGTTSGDDQPRLPIHQSVLFHCESFWVSLRASLDITAQLINQMRSLEIGEREVNYRKVASRLGVNPPLTPLAKAVKKCLKSRAFKDLDQYRHCSTHRRQVYIETHTQKTTTLVSGTAGYEAYSGSASQQLQTRVQRFLCGNPWDLQPTVDRQRPVVGFCETLLDKICHHIQVIAYHLP